MTDKKIHRVLTADGEKLRIENLTDGEEETIQDAWDDGMRDPGKLRELIGLS